MGKRVKRVWENTTVYEKALERIEWIYSEMDHVVVSVSGGKDSTVIFNLALEVASKKNLLPVNVLFIDQEAEWGATIDEIKKIMYDERVKPYWLQIPMTMTNNTSGEEELIDIWNPEKEDIFVHPYDPISIKENIYGTARFHETFAKFIKHTFEGKAALLGGVRTQESPTRLISLTSRLTYKDATWGKVLGKNKRSEYYSLYPIYDWNTTDVWKYINDNGLHYNKVYDYMFRYGVATNDMRVSSLIHETAVKNLLMLQEIEPDTWLRIQQRVPGVNTVKHLKKGSIKRPDKLPYAFSDWEEYYLYLLINLVPEKHHKAFYLFERRNKKYLINPIVATEFYQRMIDSILVFDYDLEKMSQFVSGGDFITLIKYVKNRGKVSEGMLYKNCKYLANEQR